MTTLGKTTDGGSTSTATTAKAIASVATATADGVLATGAARIWAAAGTVSVQLGVWADSSGSPGALLALSDAVSVGTTADTEVPFTFSGANLIAIVNGVAYWIGPTWALPGTTMTWSRDAVGVGNAKTVNSQAPNPFGTTSDLNGPIDAYVNHFPAVSAEDGAFFEFF
jgi:hypothetical protein